MEYNIFIFVLLQHFEYAASIILLQLQIVQLVQPLHSVSSFSSFSALQSVAVASPLPQISLLHLSVHDKLDLRERSKIRCSDVSMLIDRATNLELRTVLLLTFGDTCITAMADADMFAW